MAWPSSEGSNLTEVELGPWNCKAGASSSEMDRQGWHQVAAVHSVAHCVPSDTDTVAAARLFKPKRRAALTEQKLTYSLLNTPRPMISETQLFLLLSLPLPLPFLLLLCLDWIDFRFYALSLSALSSIAPYRGGRRLCLPLTSCWTLSSAALTWTLGCTSGMRP